MGKMRRPEWFTKEEFERLMAEGVNRETMAELCLVSLPTFTRFLREIGVEKGQGIKRKKIKPEWFTKAEYERLKAIGKTDGYIMMKSGVSFPTFMKWRKEIGIKGRTVGCFYGGYKPAGIKHD